MTRRLSSCLATLIAGLLSATPAFAFTWGTGTWGLSLWGVLDALGIPALPGPLLGLLALLVALLPLHRRMRQRRSGDSQS